MTGEEALALLDRERLRVVVEVEGNEMRLLCEGHCDLDKVVRNIVVRESKQPNGCFSLRWTQYITASERVDVTPPSLSSLSLKALSLVQEPLFLPP